MPNLSKEQQVVVRGVTKSVKGGVQITTIGGWAGTGKSTIAYTLSQVFPNFAICAYTGKAASVLRKKGMNASTIHSLIYQPFAHPDGSVEFVLKSPSEIGCNGFTIDESSMISKEIYEDLLTFNLPIIFIGDHGQLEPIGSNINIMVNPMFKLETIHRNAGEIAWFADHLRRGNPARTFDGTDKVKVISIGEVTDDMMLEVDQMICAYNKTRVEKNEHVRHLLGYKKLVEIGERVMCLKNNKVRGIFNGMQGEVTAHHDKYPRFDFTADDQLFPDILYDVNQFGKEKNQFEFKQDTPDPFDYAYCVTCHKYQGSESNDVLVFEQNCDKWDMRRWTYTSASRAKENLYWVTQKQFVPAWLK